MNKKFLSAILFGALAVASTGSFVSCKDYDDDINNLQTQIGQLANKTDLQSQVSTLQSAISTAQSAAENKAAAAQKAADDAKAEAAAAKAAAAAATTEAAKAAAEAAEKAAAEKLAEAQAAIKEANEKVAALETSLAELKTFAEGLASKEDFEAAKKTLNEEFEALKKDIEKKTGTLGMTGLSILNLPADADKAVIAAAYGKWAGVHKGAEEAEWKGSRALPAVGDPTTEFGTPSLTIAVNPTDFDLSNTEFAVVNQYGDQAPIAFGTPVAPTRALTAGVYTLPYKVGDVTKVPAFVKAFAGDGGTATLVAAGSKIAAQVRTKFVDIVAAKNADYSTFKTVVEYEDIDAAFVELKAVNAEKVYDAYIYQLDDVLAHDSLDQKLVYSGKDMILNYKASAIKAKVDKGGDYTINLKVMQINLNGYIHETTGEKAQIVFRAKKSAEDVVLEAVEIAAASHDVVVDTEIDAQGQNSSKQKTNKISLAKAYKAWGLDDVKSDDYVHWMHGTVARDVVSIYYYNAENDTVQINKDLVKDVTLDKEKATIVLAFKKDYKYTGWSKLRGAEVAEDAAWNGKKLYAEINLTLTDNTDKESNIVYPVIVPVQFNKLNPSDYYGWDAKFAQNIVKQVTATTDQIEIISNLDDLFKSKKIENKEDGTTSNAAQLIWTNKIGTKYKADGTVIPATGTGSTATPAYITPAITVTTTTSSIADYKAEAARIDSMNIGRGIDEAKDGPKTLYGKTYSKISADYKTALKAFVAAKYSKVIKPQFNNQKMQYGQAVTDSESDVWYYLNSDGTAALTTAPTTLSSPLKITADFSGFGAEKVSVKNSMLNATYTLSGFAVKIADREVATSVEIQLTSKPITTSTMTLSYNKLVNKTTAPSINLYNAAHRPLDTTGYVGTFSITDNYGYACKLTKVDNIVYNVLKANGTIVEISTGLSITTTAYGYDKDVDTAKDNDLQINVTSVIPNLEAGDKIVVTVPAANIQRYYDAKAIEEAVTFELLVVE